MISEFAFTDIHDYFEKLKDLVEGHVMTKGWEQQISLPSHIGEGAVTRWRLRHGMEIVVIDILLKQDLQWRMKDISQIVELNYCVSGNIFCEWNGNERHIGQRTGNICFLEDVPVYMETKAGVRHQSIEVRLCPDGLLQYAADPLEKQEMEKWLQRHRGRIDDCPDSPAIRKCVFDLLQCSYRGTMKRLYMEGKAMELIALFEDGERYGEALRAAEQQLLLKPDDIDRLQHVRKMILRRLENPLSIRDLSRFAGINEYKLKKGFRQLFGMTIFEYVRWKRMEKALLLMENERMNVGETASALGYSNMSNFTAAFRKQYGCNPSDYLKQICQRDANADLLNTPLQKTELFNHSFCR
ncbi:AraC-type DNA-binding protein [Evansella caseinilytica]|uniref:AraC-type DNA-binding protein n=1 Tax=Evansella caseinilytica TaxID=1503961 RepID=A0A1H3UB00_9BACI|nr:AraC family transcriptional regulator [Evansella caseinilytica]SDZ59650.1 AraC-type DNA-binding protein [Evansella caseinilytica]